MILSLPSEVHGKCTVSVTALSYSSPVCITKTMKKVTKSKSFVFILV